MSILREKHKMTTGRSLELSRTYLQRGQAVTRSLWIRVSPRHPLLKVIMALPTVALLLTMLGFTLLAVALMGAIWRAGEKDTEEG